jgi:hypothetical protein
VIAEALLRRLDPGINVIDVFRGQLGRLEAARFAPENLRHDGADMLRAMEHLTRDLPRNVEKILRRLGQGDLGRYATRIWPARSGGSGRRSQQPPLPLSAAAPSSPRLC